MPGSAPRAKESFPSDDSQNYQIGSHRSANGSGSKGLQIWSSGDSPESLLLLDKGRKRSG
jgi:hypothetical protein